ncbi:MAG: hypothetical protein RL030_2509 [Pseudomonadota bacterium]
MFSIGDAESFNLLDQAGPGLVPSAEPTPPIRGPSPHPRLSRRYRQSLRQRTFRLLPASSQSIRDTCRCTAPHPWSCRRVTRAAKRSGLSRSEIVRDAVRRQLALVQFQDLRRRIMPLAEARGYLTDEDVFRDIS